MANHCANVEDMDGVNTKKFFKAMEVKFETIMDQEFNEKVSNKY